MQKENQHVPSPPARPAPDQKTVLDYLPLVKATACRYQGRGAEYEDLVQEGCLALLVLIPKCPDIKWLAYFLKSHLPGYIRDAAARLRKARALGAEAPLEALEEILGSEEPRYREAELSDALRRALTPAELALALALAGGASQREAARELGVSQQAVAQRLKKIRCKLKAALDG